MKIVILNKSDSTGGAAVVSRRLMEALRNAGHDARMLVVEKLSDSPFVESVGGLRSKATFLSERLGIFLANGFNRADLFKVDTASSGLPLWNHPLVKEADVVCLNWINQGMLSLSGVRRIARMGKPVVWTMHDMWNMTGICHHAATCTDFHRNCGNCMFLGSRAADNDLSARVWNKKNAILSDLGIRYVAVSSWLASRARKSSLLRSADVRVIPNAFCLPDVEDHPRNDAERVIIMGAARLDDPIKGLPVLKEALRILAEENVMNFRLVTFGGVKDPEQLSGFAVPHTHLGTLRSEAAVAEAMGSADVVVSASYYETLPGTLVEGQAFGAVPVGFRSGGQSDIIDDGVTGCLADPDPRKNAEALADAIKRAVALQSDSTRRKMRESVERKFASTRVADAYISLFREICRNNT